VGEALLDDIDDYVHLWHEGAGDPDASLADFLGFTDEEYKLWAEKPNSLPFILKAQKTTTRHTAKNSGLLPRKLRVSSRISGRCQKSGIRRWEARRMDWQQLLQALQQHVGRGQVTTYANCSQWAYGHRGGCPAVVSMLNKVARNGHQQLTNRVVQRDGGIAPEPDQAYGQRAQLQAEGVPFTPQGRVDFARLPAVEFGGRADA